MKNTDNLDDLVFIIGICDRIVKVIHKGNGLTARRVLGVDNPGAIEYFQCEKKEGKNHEEIDHLGPDSGSGDPYARRLHEL
jgi:hypothetical protein